MNKIDLEDVKFSLDNIASTLGPVMEDMEQEHLYGKARKRVREKEGG